MTSPASVVRECVSMIRRLLAAAALIALGAAPAPTIREDRTLTVPGFADFLAVEDDTVWATNRGRVERWSRTGKLAEVAMPHPCGAMALTPGNLWVADCDERALHRIDTRTARTIATIPTGIANPKGELNVVAGAGSIWVASDATGKVARVDPAANRLVATVRVDPGTFFLGFGFGSLWAVSSDARSLQRIDPRTNMVTKRIALGKQPGFLVAGEGAVWVQEQGDGTVVRVNPGTDTVTGRVKVADDLLYGDIDAGGGAVWLRTTAGQTFAIIDPRSLAIVAREGKPAGSGALRYAGSGLWTSAHDVHTLTWWSVAGKQR